MFPKKKKKLMLPQEKIFNSNVLFIFVWGKINDLAQSR